MGEPSLTPALLGILGAMAVGLLGIAGAMFLKIFRSPESERADLATQLLAQRRDHHGLSENVAVLSNEVKHLGEIMRSLAEEVKWLREQRRRA